jgi:hypothetical protein
MHLSYIATIKIKKLLSPDTVLPERKLLGRESFCDASAKDNKDFKRYFDGMDSIYKENVENTCLPVHKQWLVFRVSF